MQVTDEMVDAGLRITLSSVGLPAGECLHATDVREILTAALSDKQAVEVKADRGDLLSLIKWAHETLYEINPSNYDHDEVCKLNDASVEVILGLAQALGERHGYSADWWEKYRTDHPLPALVDVPAVEPVAWQYFNDGAWRHSTNPKYHRETGYEMRPLFAHPPLREGEDSAEVYERCAKLAEERASEVRYASWAVALKRLAQEIRALAAMRSGSATTHSGGGE